MPLTQFLQNLRCTNRPSNSDLPRPLLTTRTIANHTAKQGTGRLWSAPKGTTIVLVEESTDAELEEAEYLISNQQDLTDILGRLGVSGLKDPDQPREGIHLFEQLQDGKTYLPRGRVASKTVQVAQKNLVHGAEDTACSALKLALEQQIDQPVQVYEREYVKTGKDAGKPLGEVDGLLGVGKRVFVLMHKSVMTVDKVLASRRKLRDFCKKVRESSEAPLVHLKGKQLCLVLATDYIPHGVKDDVHELCQFYGIPLLLPSQHYYQLDNHVSLNDANNCVPT